MEVQTITPETIEDTAQAINRSESPETVVTDDGFILQHSKNRKGCTFVGVREDGDMYVVAKMFRKQEQIGTHDSRIQTSQNEYVECQLHRIEIPRPQDTDETVESLAEAIDNSEYQEQLDTGYINGYRLTPLSQVLDDIFKWY